MTALIDTGIFFGFFSVKDVHHLDSIAIIIDYTKGRWGKGYVTNHILDETLNLLKYRISPEAARVFIEKFIDQKLIEILYTDSELEKEALQLFKKNTARKGFSYTDAVTAAAIRHYGTDHLLTYDLRSFQGLIDNITGPNYWNTLPPERQKQILELARKHTPR